MRSGSTCRPAIRSRPQAAAEPARRSRSANGSHSACQAPAARSCSSHHRPGQRQRAGPARAGRRPPAPPRRPGCACGPSTTIRRGAAHLDLADLVLREQGDVAADAPERAREQGQRRGQRGERERSACQGRTGSASPSSPASGGRGLRCAGAHRPAELRGGCERRERAGGGVDAGHPAGRLQAEGRGQRLAQQRAADHRGVAVRARPGRRSRRPRRRASASRIASERAGDEHRRGVEDVLAGRPERGRARRPRGRPRSRSAATSGDHRVAVRAARPADAPPRRTRSARQAAAIVGGRRSAGAADRGRARPRRRAWPAATRRSSTCAATPPRAKTAGEQRLRGQRRRSPAGPAGGCRSDSRRRLAGPAACARRSAGTDSRTASWSLAAGSSAK